MKKRKPRYTSVSMAALAFVWILALFFMGQTPSVRSKYLQEKRLPDKIELAMINYQIPDNISVKDILESGPDFQKHIAQRFALKQAYQDKENHSDWNTDSSSSQPSWIDYKDWALRQHPDVEKIIFANAEEYQSIFDGDDQKIDVSATRSKTIFLCKSPDAPKTAYVLRTGANEYPRIFANPDCSGMFENLVHLKTIDFGTTTVAPNADRPPKESQPLKTTGWRIDPSVLAAEPFFSTVLTQRMERMFYYCVRLTNIGYTQDQGEFNPAPGQNGARLLFNTSRTRRMERMFTACRSLRALDVRSFETSQVEDMQETFSDCLALTDLQVDMDKFDTSKVQNMKSMFHRSYSLSTLDKVIGKFNTANVLNMEEMFSDCYSLNTLDLSSFDTSKVGSQPYRDLSGNMVQGSMAGMFAECSNLQTILLKRPQQQSGFDTSKVPSMASMFRNCKKLTSVQWTDQPVQSALLLDLTLFNTENVEDMNLMLGGCNSAQDIRFASSIDTSKVRDMSLMFADCFELKALDLSGFDTSSVVSMKEMFRTCRSLRTMDIRKFQTEKTMDMSLMFANCAQLQTVYLPISPTAPEALLDSMFASSSALKHLDMSGFDPSQAKSMKDFLAYCWNLETIRINPETFRLPDDQPIRTMIVSGEKFKYLQLGDLCISHPTRSWASDALAERIAGLGLSFSSLKTDGIPADSMPILLQNVLAGIANLKRVRFEDLNITLQPDLRHLFNDFTAQGVEIEFLHLPSTEAITIQDLFKGYRGSSYSVRKCDGGLPDDKMDLILGSGLSISSLDLTGLDMAELDSHPLTQGRTLGQLLTRASHPNLTTVRLGTVVVRRIGPDSYIFDGLNTQDCSVRRLEIQQLDLTQAGQVTLERLFPKLDFLKIDSVVLPDNSRMNGLFKGIKAARLDISQMDTSQAVDMSYMFADTSDLVWLDVGQMNTAGVTNMAFMFAGASALESINVNSFDTRNVTSMSHMFANTTSLASLDFGQAKLFQTSKVQDFSSMFAGSPKLWSLDLSGFDTSQAVDMSYMFKDCTNLATTALNGAAENVLNLSGFSTANVTSMAGMFAGCTNLQNISFGAKFDTSQVKDMSSMFASVGLWQINLSFFNTSSVENMASMFKGSRQMTKILMEGWDTTKVRDMSGMFEDCSNLPALDLSAFRTANVTSMASMFKGASLLQAIDWGTGFQTCCVEDMSRMFMECTSIKVLDLSHFETPNVQSLESMFEGCKSLTALTLSNFQNPKVVNMKRTFARLYGLDSAGWKPVGMETLDLSGFKTPAAQTMEQMFASSGKLTSLDLSGFETGNVITMEEMFDSCEALQTVNLSGFDVTRLTNLRRMFNRCLALTTIYSNQDWTFGQGIEDTELFGAYLPDADTHCNNLSGGRQTSIYHILYWSGTHPSQQPDPASVIRLCDLLRLDDGPWSSRPGVFTMPPEPQTQTMPTSIDQAER